MTTTQTKQAPTSGAGAAIQTTRWIAQGVRLAGAVCAFPLVANLVLTVFNADPINPMTRFFAATSNDLALWFTGLFTPADPKLALVINHGLAALVWLLAAAIVAHLVRQLCQAMR
jgi:hypothetical protein